MYSIEEFDEAKTRVLKYILYKKRSEYEIRTKFSKSFEEELLNDVIEELKEIGYIDDKKYIEKAISEFKILNNLSIKEVKYKLMSKGIKTDIVEDYISENCDEMIEYELKSAQNIARKKSSLEKEELERYLYKKGYLRETISKI